MAAGVTPRESGMKVDPVDVVDAFYETNAERVQQGLPEISYDDYRAVYVEMSPELRERAQTLLAAVVTHDLLFRERACDKKKTTNFWPQLDAEGLKIATDYRHFHETDLPKSDYFTAAQYVIALDAASKITQPVN